MNRTATGTGHPQADEVSAQIARLAYRQRLDTFLASRDAGRALTLDALRAGIRLEAVVDSAARVAAYADEALGIVAEEYRPRLDCAESCCYCCCKPGVLISIPELMRILEHVSSSFDEGQRRAVRERAAIYASQIEGRSFNESFRESVPCPLLVDSRCSVYELRPLVCRGYNSTDVGACRRAHADPGELVPIFSVLKDVTDGATVGAAQGLATAGFDDALVDLGTALNLAFAAGEGCAEAVMAGDAPLDRAQNRNWVRNLWAQVRKTARSVGVRI